MFTSRVKIDDESPYSTPFATANRLVEVVDGDQRGRRAEDLLLRDPHLRLDVAEDRRPVVEALVEPVAARDLAAGEQLRALVRGRCSVYEWIFSSARWLITRADVGVVLPARAEPQLLGRGDEPRLQLARRRPAARSRGWRRCSAGRRCRTPTRRSLDREVEVGVVEDDDRVLAAELEVDVLQVRRPRSSCTATPVSREPVKRDHRHVGMADRAVADLLAAAVDDVDDARAARPPRRAARRSARRAAACPRPA